MPDGGAGIHNTFHSREDTSSEAPLDWFDPPRLDVPSEQALERALRSARAKLSS